MASTFDYRSGKVTFDFKLKKCGSVCRRHDRHTSNYIGNDVCTRCRSYCGERNGYVLCKYHASDDIGAEDVYRQLREELMHEALCAMCY